MAKYLYQISYTPESVAAMLKSPQNRVEAVTPVIERLGGKVEAFWMSLGDYDIVGVCEMPDNVSSTAFSMTVKAGGGVTAFKTTPLLSVEEGVDAMRKGGDTGYTPPGR